MPHFSLSCYWGAEVMEFALCLVALGALVLSNTVINEVAAEVCYVGQELDGSRYKWVLGVRDPCECTEIRLGGVNTISPACRPTNSRYMEDLVLGDDVQRIREWLECPEKTTVETEMTSTFEGKTTSVSLCDTVVLTVQNGQSTPYLAASLNEQSVWILNFSLSMNANGIIYLARTENGATEDMLLIDIKQNQIEIQNPSGGQIVPPVTMDIGTTRHTLTIGDEELILDDTDILSGQRDLVLTNVKFGCVSGVECVWTLYVVPCSWKPT